MKQADYIVFKIYDSDRQGSEVARIKASTYKWGPGNAFEIFVRDNHPKPGDYIVVGPGSPTTTMCWSRYSVAYPEYVINGTRAGGLQMYGDRTKQAEVTSEVAQDQEEAARREIEEPDSGRPTQEERA